MLNSLCRRQFSASPDGNLTTHAGKSMNLYSAINQALHIALETDPRFVSSIPFSSFLVSDCLYIYIFLSLL